MTVAAATAVINPLQSCRCGVTSSPLVAHARPDGLSIRTAQAIEQSLCTLEHESPDHARRLLRVAIATTITSIVMRTQRRRSFVALLVIVLTMLATIGRESTRAAQQTSGAIASCDMDAVALTKAGVPAFSALHRFDPGAASMDEVRAASLAYVAQAEACYHDLFGPAVERIDDGGMTLSVAGAARFGIAGTNGAAARLFHRTGRMPTDPAFPAARYV